MDNKYSEVYESIISDSTWQEWMEEIVDNPTGDPKLITDHGPEHAKRVLAYGERFLDQFFAYEEYQKYSKTVKHKRTQYETELGLFQVAAVLHDIGYAKPEHEGHAKISAEMAAEYLKKYPDLSEKERGIITHAIRRHSGWAKPTSLLDSVLVLSDKLDVSYARYLDPRTVDDRKIGRMIREQRKVSNVMFDLLEPMFDSDGEFKYYSTARLTYSLKLHGDQELNNGLPYDVAMLAEWPKALIIPRNVALYTCSCRNFQFTVNGVKIDEKTIVRE